MDAHLAQRQSVGWISSYATPDETCGLARVRLMREQ